MSPGYPCCCDEDDPDPGFFCTGCSDCAPSIVTVTFAGLSECSDCLDLQLGGSKKVEPNQQQSSPLNGTFVLPYVSIPINSCGWILRIEQSWLESSYPGDTCGGAPTEVRLKDSFMSVVPISSSEWRVIYFLTTFNSGSPWPFFAARFTLGQDRTCSGFSITVPNEEVCGQVHQDDNVVPWAFGGSAQITFGTCTPP